MEGGGGGGAGGRRVMLRLVLVRGMVRVMVVAVEDARVDGRRRRGGLRERERHVLRRPAGRRTSMLEHPLMMSERRRTVHRRRLRRRLHIRLLVLRTKPMIRLAVG